MSFADECFEKYKPLENGYQFPEDEIICELARRLKKACDAIREITLCTGGYTGIDTVPLLDQLEKSPE